jgi:hypothetical protein
MRIEMREELIKQINLEQSQIPTSYYLLETKKIIILEQLEHAITKLKQAQLEIREAVQETLKMKEDSDDIADQVIATVAELVMAK